MGTFTLLRWNSPPMTTFLAMICPSTFWDASTSASGARMTEEVAPAVPTRPWYWPSSDLESVRL